MKQSADKYNINIKALLLLTVFLFALLAKPVHILMEHSQSVPITAFYSDKDLFVPDHHFDCEICEFEFATFLSGENTHLPVAEFHLIQVNSDKPAQQPLHNAYYCNFLRAPPTI
ncbi:MAG: hypothetical protein PHH37_02475 [Paludibacter sp.]|nr:hypothetical protein [Paludibacter sp.]